MVIIRVRAAGFLLDGKLFSKLCSTEVFNVSDDPTADSTADERKQE